MMGKLLFTNAFEILIIHHGHRYYYLIIVEIYLIFIEARGTNMYRHRTMLIQSISNKIYIVNSATIINKRSYSYDVSKFNDS